MEWRFTLTDRNSISTVIDEPNGWKELFFKLKRHPERHGTFREIQGNTFEFFEVAAKMIRAEYELYAVQGIMYLLIEMKIKRIWEFFHSGILNFKSYDWNDDVNCYVDIDVDQTGTEVDFINRFDQPVDITKNKTFDGVTDLAAYDFLDFNMTLPSKAILLQAEANTDTLQELIISSDSGWVWATGTGTLTGSIIPVFTNITKSSFNVFTPSVLLDFLNFSGAGEIVQPVLLNQVDENLHCFTSSFNVNYRVKGRYIHNATSNTGDDTLALVLKKGTGANYNDAGIIIESNFVMLNRPLGAATIKEFDYTYTGVITLAPDEKLWLNFFYTYHRFTFGSESIIKLQIDPDTRFYAEAISKCDPTTAKVFMINETVSRLIESITDNTFRLYSEYFGRTNSQPYSFASNGCGSLRTINNGLAIRNAKLPDGSRPGIFISMKDIFESLNAVDNIGLGIEGNNVRIENWKYFYNDTVIHRCLNIAKLKRSALEKEIFSGLKIGYDKWEAEDYNGLDEFLTEREYRLDIKQVKNVLEQICKFIVSGYAIEVTKRKGQNSTDWRFDNNIFMICVEPDGSTFKVELNNILDPLNMIDPPTIYNFRLSPTRNAIRWFDKVIGSYRNVNSGHKIIFAKAKGNYIAEGNLFSVDCKLEFATLKENQDLSLTDFEFAVDGMPIMFPERVKYQYPLGANEYKAMAANPNGLIEFSSPSDSGFGWIDELVYRPNEGMADYTLIPKI